jgi:hypothetical protein
MARQRIQYDGRAEALQTVAAPRVSAVQAQNDPRGSRGFALAEALGASAPLIDEIQKRAQLAEEDQATRFAMGLTAEELGKAVRDGKLLPSQSPVFVATVNHIWGENQAAVLRGEVESRLASGNTFGSNEELEEFLIGKRNELLAGGNSYAAAGFDKNFQSLRAGAMTANQKVISKQLEERAVAEVTDSFYHIYRSASADPNIGTEDRIALITERWQAFRRDGLLGNAERQRDIMMNILSQAAQNKDQGFLDQMLDSTLSDGITVRSFIKPDKALAILKQIDQVETAEYYRSLRQKNEATDLLEREIAAALEAGGDPKALVNDPRFSSLSGPDRMAMIERSANTWRKFNGVEQAFEDSRKSFIIEAFNGIEDPEEAMKVKMTLLSDAGSSLEKSFIREVAGQAKITNPYSDAGFVVGRRFIQQAHNSTDIFFNTNTVGAALNGFQSVWRDAWFTPGDQLYEQHKDVIPQEYKGRNLARLPLRVKEALAQKLGKPFADLSPIGKNQDPLSSSARPGNPNSDKTLNKGETIIQNGIRIQKQPD